MTDWLRRRPTVALGLLAAAPLVVAAIALLFRPWVPVLDMAMTEFRVRDVGGVHTPLVGLPGRIGNFPDQGSHPGPWSFYLIAPFYRLAGSTAWGMELGSVIINAACVVGLTVMGHRRFGRVGAAVFAAIGAVAVRGYGLTVLTHPWNPYFPVLLWMVALFAAWFVLMGRPWFAVLVALTTIVAAQTHVPYLVSAIALDVSIVGWLAWRWWRLGDRAARTPLLAMLVTAAVLWLPPVAEQLRHGRSDGNIAKLVRHFATEPPEAAIGIGSATKLLTQHFDVAAIARDLLVRDDAFVGRAGQIGSTSPVGALVLVAWAAAAVWAVRRRHHDLIALHAVIAVTLVAGWLSITRIFGKVWFYLTLWMSSTVVLVVVALVWTIWILLRERMDADGRSVSRRRVAVLAVTIGAIATACSLVAAVGQQVPERNLADDVRHIVPQVTEVLDREAATATTTPSYVVFWQEAVVPGAQGYALMNELERRGYRVGVHPTWRVPATPHRVRIDGQYDREIHLVSGSWIDVWRTRVDQGYEEIVDYDGRSPEQLRRFDLLDRRVIDRLTEIGRTDLIDMVGTNIFGASLVPDLPRDIVDDLSEMLLIGEPVAVFLAPAGSTF